MSNGYFPLKKALQVFGCSEELLRSHNLEAFALPDFSRSESDNRRLKSWSLRDLPEVGAQVGFLQKPSTPLCVAVFVTKGGVLKSSLTLNLARMAALHGMRTCVVGLDMQGDVTTALAGEETPDDDSSLDEAVAKINQTRGLAQVFTGECSLADAVKPTDLPTLFYIPETPELVALDQSLINRNRREYWLRDHVIKPLKNDFDLIVLDCSPNWNRLITNALVACDALVSPLECKINNFRNFKTFHALLREFKRDMGTEFTQVFVPTRLSPARKLSREICAWYQANLSDCCSEAVRESVQGEEAMAMRMSIPEYAPTSAAADEMRSVLKEIWETISLAQNDAVALSPAKRAAEVSM